jgi:uncharacterized protein (TIGR02996 family)
VHAMPTYEFAEGGSSKFWKIDLDGTGFTARWGKIGTKGQEKRQDFATAAEAKKEYEKLIASKLKKGYRCVDGAEKPAQSEASGSNPELEAAILANLGDPTAYLIYADWLQGQGDPRGELISVQHARLTADTAALRKREAQLLEGQTDALFGELAPLLKENGGLSVTWHLGFLKTARIAQDTYDSALDVGATIAAVLELPIATQLEAISIGLCQEPDGDGDLQVGIDALIEAGGPKTLQSIFLGDFEFPDQSDISSTQVGDVSGLYRAFPALRSLKLRGAQGTLGKIDLPELRDFTFETGGLSRDCLDAICAAHWPKLERLTLWLGDENYGSEADFDALAPILSGKGLGALRHLALANCEFVAGNIDALAKAKLLPQLKTLDLSMGRMGDEDAEAILRHADAFKHLEQLVVSDNYFTRRGLYLLRKAVRDVVSNAQNEAATPDDRYVAVGE